MMLGTRFSHYEIRAKLGGGGMGVVYRARDVKLDRDVAIKVLRTDIAPDNDRRRRIEREARAAFALNHPNIVTIYEIGEHAGTSFLAMEYVEGRTLRSLLGDGPLPTAQILDISRQIVEGLARAHAAGIVHRDLKPENVMVGADGYARILDFGLAKLWPKQDRAALDSEQETVERFETRTGTLLGTPAYMSPEQARGLPVDSRSDLFSLGAILYEMATGERLFARPSPAETLAAVLEPRPSLAPLERASVPDRFSGGGAETTRARFAPSSPTPASRICSVARALWLTGADPPQPPQAQAGAPGAPTLWTSNGETRSSRLARRVDFVLQRRKILTEGRPGLFLGRLQST